MASNISAIALGVLASLLIGCELEKESADRARCIPFFCRYICWRRKAY